MAVKRPTRATARAKRDKLITETLFIVAPIARMIAQQVPDSFELEDLIGTGTIALVECAERYRPSEHGGAPFSAYARMRVRGAMLDSIKGRHFQRAKLTGAIEDAPEPVAEPDTSPEAIDQARQLERVFAAIDQLTPRSREILRLHYRFELTRGEMAELFEVHESRVNKLHSVAIRELRQVLGVDV